MLTALTFNSISVRWAVCWRGLLYILYKHAVWGGLYPVAVQLLSCVWLHGLQPTRILCPWGFTGKNWSGLPFPSPGDLLGAGSKLTSPALQVDSLPLSHQGNRTLPYMLFHLKLYLLQALLSSLKSLDFKMLIVYFNNVWPWQGQ